MIDVNNMVRSAFIAGGNGLPEIEILPTDTLEYIGSQVMARQASGDIHEISESKATTAPAAQVSSFANGIPLVGGMVDSLKQSAQGLVILAVLLLFGAALVVLGAYQFTKE